MTAPSINEIVRRRRAVTAEMPLRFARYFGTSAQLWLNLQSQYDLDIASRKIGRRLERAIHHLALTFLSPVLPDLGSQLPVPQGGGIFGFCSFCLKAGTEHHGSQQTQEAVERSVQAVIRLPLSKQRTINGCDAGTENPRRHLGPLRWAGRRLWNFAVLQKCYTPSGPF